MSFVPWNEEVEQERFMYVTNELPWNIVLFDQSYHFQENQWSEFLDFLKDIINENSNILSALCLEKLDYEFFEEILQEINIVLLAFTLLPQFTVLGLAMATRKNNEVVFLELLCAKNQFQIPRLGSTMLRVLENYCSKVGVCEIQLSSVSEAILFYEKQGYKNDIHPCNEIPNQALYDTDLSKCLCPWKKSQTHTKKRSK